MQTRSKRLFLTAIAVGALAVGALSAPLPATAESNGGVKIMPLGDSITEGTATPGGYRITLWQRLAADGDTNDFVGSQFNGPSSLGDHDHEGHPGWRIDQIDTNIVGWLNTYQPRTVLLHIGTNDVLQNYNVSTAPTRLATLIDKILNTLPNVHLFVATIIPLSNSGQETAGRTFNAQIPSIVQTRANAGKHIMLVDMHAALTTADLADGIHPTPAGYQKMANTWWTAMQTDPTSYKNGTTTTTTTTSRTSTTTTTRGTTSSTTSTTTQTTSSTGGTGACTATYTVVNAWQGGFVSNVNVTAGSASITGWRVALTLPSGASITNLWNGVVSGSSGTVTVSNAGYNGQLGAGQSTSFGFQGNGTGTGATVSCAAA